MTERNEHTSPEIATVAAVALSMSDAEIVMLATKSPELIRSLAASALTQTKDHGGTNTAA